MCVNTQQYEEKSHAVLREAAQLCSSITVILEPWLPVARLCDSGKRTIHRYYQTQSSLQVNEHHLSNPESKMWRTLRFKSVQLTDLLTHWE